ncbi:MAG: hypothetical protein ABI678_28970 [Kofleriaceae bacterium]
MSSDPESAGERPFYDVELRQQGVIIRRTTRRYLVLSEIAPSFAALDVHFAKLAPGAQTLLVDLRAIVGRNDEGFEAALAPLLRELLSKFARAGLIVRTTIGRLQLERYFASDGIAARVFSDENEAMAWFLGFPG